MSPILCFHRMGEFHSYKKVPVSEFEMRHLRLVITVAEERSITKASHRLHVTQSALSHQLRDIEARLGTKLFLRANKKMVLTPAGETLHTAALRLLRDLEEVETAVREMSFGEVGKIRLSTECYTCYHWLPQALKRFRSEFSRVSVEIDVAATRHPLEALFKNQIDVAIISTPVRDKRLRLRPLFGDEMLVLMRADDPLATRPYIRAIDFADVTLMTYSPTVEENVVFRQVLNPAGVKPREVLPIGLTEAMIEMVRAGLGICVLAKWAIGPNLKDKTLKAVPLTARGLRRQWSAATLRNRGSIGYAEEFVELLASQSATIFKQLEKHNRIQVA